MDCYNRIRDFFRLIGSAFAVALFGLLILWVAAYCYYGNATLGIDRLRGNSIIVENVKIDSHAVNQESGSVRFSLNIHNLASNPIKIVGLSAGCSCIHFDKIPLTLQANKLTKLDGTLHLRKGFQGNFRYEAMMLFDEGTAPVVFYIEG